MINHSIITGILLLALAGCASIAPVEPAPSIEFKLGEVRPSDGLTPATIIGSGQEVYLYDEAVLTYSHIVSVAVDDAKYGPQIIVTFTNEGRDIFASVTRNNISKPLAIIIDGKVIAAPVIQAEITGGKAVIIGPFTPEEASRLARGIMGKTQDASPGF